MRGKLFGSRSLKKILPPTCLLIAILLADQSPHRVRTTVEPFEEPTALIVDGAYSIVRHPMYLGCVFVLLGSSGRFGWLIDKKSEAGYNIVLLYDNNHQLINKGDLI